MLCLVFFLTLVGFFQIPEKVINVIMDNYSLLRGTIGEGTNHRRSVGERTVQEGIVREGNVLVGIFLEEMSR